MKKPLELDEVTARKLYPSAAPEFKELLEQNFGGKEFFNQKIIDKVKVWDDVLREYGRPNELIQTILNYTGVCKESIFIQNVTKAMMLASVLNEGKIPNADGRDKRRFRQCDFR